MPSTGLTGQGGQRPHRSPPRGGCWWEPLPVPGGADALPDEAFARIRGALFCGAGFRPTRNKLTMSDDLLGALSRATSHDRHLERSFRDWLGRCHREFDKGVAFTSPLPNAVQAKVTVLACAFALR